jgi:hypothetical protein
MGSPSHLSSNTDDLFITVIAKISELYQLRDTYYPDKAADKKTKLDDGLKEVLLMIETLANENLLASKRGQVAYLRGKALDVGPEFSKEAEEQLSKAVSSSAHSNITIYKRGLYFLVYPDSIRTLNEIQSSKLSLSWSLQDESQKQMVLADLETGFLSSHIS